MKTKETVTAIGHGVVPSPACWTGNSRLTGATWYDDTGAARPVAAWGFWHMHRGVSITISAPIPPGARVELEVEDGRP